MTVTPVMGAQSVFLTFVGGSANGRIGAVGNETVSSLGWGGGSQHYFSDYIPTTSGEVLYGYYQRYASNEGMTKSQVGLYDSSGNKLVESNSQAPTVCPTNANKFRWELSSSYTVESSTEYWCAKVTNDGDWQRSYSSQITGSMWRDSDTWANSGNGWDSTTMHATISKDSTQTTSGKLKIWFSNSDSDWGE
jgi:hypothetical protein